MSEHPQVPTPLQPTLDAFLGFEILELGDMLARASVPVSDRVKQSHGLVHGGVYAALAESLASEATLRALDADGSAAVGLSNQTSFVRPITAGVVQAEARRRHRGRTTWVWDVDLTDADGHLCAVSRVTVAIRPASQDGSAHAQE